MRQRRISADAQIENCKLKINTGFTLIELLLTMAIMSFVGLLTVPFYGRFLTQNAVSNTQDQIIQDLRKAQFYALVSRKSNSGGWGVNWDDATNTLTLYQGSDYQNRNQALDETFPINDNITISGLTDLNFPRLTGVPAAGATITISGQNTTKTITVNGQGIATR